MNGSLAKGIPFYVSQAMQRERIEKEIKDTVRIPQDSDVTVEGTTLLPSDAAKEMDDSVGMV